MASVAEWKLLARLFSDDRAAFRHHLSLARTSAAEFYAPTPAAAAIRSRKEAILGGPDGEQYRLATEEGMASLAEFCALLGVAGIADGIALEPDLILLAAPAWRVVWASVCFPTRWSLAGKRGQPLPDIHAVVPGLNAELGAKIAAFFARLAPGDGWSRANWGLSSNPEPNQHPSRPYTPLSVEMPLEQIQLRLESQHLLKLPGTGAIAFGIRIVNFPLPEVRQVDAIAAGLREQLRTMPAEVAAYKGIPSDLWKSL